MGNPFSRHTTTDIEQTLETHPIGHLDLTTTTMSSSSPSDKELEKKIQALIPRVDVETMGLKQFMKLLSKEIGGIDLKSRKAFIKEALTEAISKMNQAADAGESDEEESEEEAPAPKKKKGGGGLAEKKEISDKLAAFLRKGKKMARTEIVKSLWEYIREHDLQNPDNKREIFLDEAMKDVFGCDTFTMFTMNKYIGAHIDPFKPVDLTTSPTKKRKAATPSKTSATKKKRKAGTQPPYQLSVELIEIVGKSVLPRPQVVKAIWVYIKANNLQNPEDKREILCDEKLKAVMKTKKVSMFKMAQLITPHLLERLDKAAYQHDHEENSDSEGDDSSPS
jgi:upstream activation factor subunit UAF30